MQFFDIFFLSIYLKNYRTSVIIEECKIVKTGEVAGEISHLDIDEEYINKVTEAGLPIDCLWQIEVRPSWGV